MKKLLFSVIMCLAFFALLSHHEVLWSKLQWLEAPQVHQVQKGESLSKLAQQNYGKADYWRELALVNRAPKPDHIEPGEEILLPSAQVIQELRRSRTMTRVNGLVGEQQLAAAHGDLPESYSRVEPAQTADEIAEPMPVANVQTEEVGQTSPPIVVSEPVAAPVQEQQESGWGGFWFWLILALFAAGGALGFFLYRRKLAKEEPRADAAARANGESRNFQWDRRPLTPSKTEGATV